MTVYKRTYQRRKPRKTSDITLFVLVVLIALILVLALTALATTR